MAKAKASRLTQAQREALIPTIVNGMMLAGEAAEKVAPTILKYFTGIPVKDIDAAKTAIYDGIRSKAPRTERGALCPKAKLPPNVAAAYQCAAMAIGRALKKLSRASNNGNKGGRKSRTVGVYSQEESAKGIKRMQDAEDCPMELLAAWQALAATAAKFQ